MIQGDGSLTLDTPFGGFARQENSTIMLENYTRVRLQTDKYQAEGASKGTLGYIVEVYPPDAYEVEFSDRDGTTFAQIVAQGDELQSDEPVSLTQMTAAGETAAETTYHAPLFAEQRSELTRSNKQ